MTAVAGADGCRGGWAIVELRDDGVVDARVVPAIAPDVDRVARGALGALAIDMPIGLPGDGRRACDGAVRALLGPRRSSVFPTPARAVLGARDHADACERSAAVCGRRLSVQAYNLLPKIDELDRVMSPPLQARVVEAHPELAFARLAGVPMAHPKRTPQGQQERRAILARAGLTDLPTTLPGAAADDLADAAALALVAAAVAGRCDERIGDGTRDARGLRMEIVTLTTDPGGSR